MPNYTKQHFRYDCFPATMANALKWAGGNISYRKERAKLWKMSGCKPKAGGCSWWEHSNALVRVGKGHFSTAAINNPRIRELDSHLAAGGAIALSYIDWPNPRLPLVRHVVLVTGAFKGKSGVKYYCIVDPTVGKIENVPRLYVRMFHLRFRFETDPTTAFLLSRI